MGLRLKERYLELTRLHERLLRFVKDLQGVAPIKWIFTYRNHIALFLHVLWIAGCGYWIYRLLKIRVTPSTFTFVTITDPQDARIFLFFGVFGGFFIIFFFLFAFKFIYNLFHDGIYRILPMQWYSLGKSISYLIILGFAFMYIKHVKIAGLTIYNRITEIASISEQHDEVVLEKLSDLQELLKGLDDRKKEEGR